MTVFVILQYMSFEMTVECITTIEEKCINESYHIIIVDNASPNQSGEKIKEKYNKDEHITVLLNKDNLGFANGNNIGYKMAKKLYSPDFIVIMNNDVLIDDSSFVTKIKSDYEKYNFKILGPDIYAIKKKEHQSPMRLEPYSIKEIEKIIDDRERWLLHYNYYFIKQELIKWLRRVKKMLMQKKEGNSGKDYIKDFLFNPVLHGACIIFSKDYIKNEENAFNSNTFLYFEEDILNYYCRNKGYLMLYDGNISVTHLEDISTNMAFKNAYQKKKMKYKCLIESANVLLQMMREFKA